MTTCVSTRPSWPDAQDHPFRRPTLILRLPPTIANLTTPAPSVAYGPMFIVRRLPVVLTKIQYPAPTALRALTESQAWCRGKEGMGLPLRRLGMSTPHIR